MSAAIQRNTAKERVMENKTDQERGSERQGEKRSFRGRGFFRRLRVCPFEGEDVPINYKDVKLLKQFITERGKIMPRRLTFVSAKKQRELSRAIKRARFLALLPYTTD